MLTFKLASFNLRNSISSFAPFLVACLTMFVLLFVTASISFSSSIQDLQGGKSIILLMKLTLGILAIFSLIILIYSYQFLQVRRSKEFGLYDILGFGKVKIILVAFWELLLSYILVILAGTVIGIAFAKFLFLVFVNISGGTNFNLAINFLPVGLAGAILLIIFLVLFVIGSIIIGKTSSLNLLKAEAKGEREPEASWLLALIGLALIGIGYWIALRVTNPVKALESFFIAVLAVIFGTYLFYIATTVWFLKWRKNRPSYYQPKNFITISSLLYRMKANAVGLASITILLSMSVVTLVVTIGLYFGSSQNVNERYPKEGNVRIINGETSEELSPTRLIKEIEQTAKMSGIKISSVGEAQFSGYTGYLDASKKQISQGNLQIAEEKPGSDHTYQVLLTTISSLKALGVKGLPQLKENEVLLTGMENIKRLSWCGATYRVKASTENLMKLPHSPSVQFDRASQLVFANEKEMKAALNLYNKRRNIEQNIISTQLLFDITPADEAKFIKAAQSNQVLRFSLIFRTQEMASNRIQVSGFAFIGFVLGGSFILGVALIIYYKQLSEGNQDKRSFKILQEVGLSEQEVKKTIQAQVRLIFFLPILVSVIHFGFAYNMVVKMEQLFDIHDDLLMLEISVVTILAVTLFYWLIYRLTSNVYYKIVKR